MSKRIIVGKNSKIIRLINSKIKNIDLISHKDISKVNFKAYDYIYLFSWSRNYLSENIKLLNKLPKKKVIFVSSVSVLSLQKRMQWNSYPNNKKIVEDLVLKNAGSVIRLGIFDDLKDKHNSPVIPYTSNAKLLSVLNQKLFKNEIYDCFELYFTKKNLNFFDKFFYKASLAFSNLKILRKSCEAVSKYILKSVFYGYTADTLTFFCENLQIGYGAIGSEHKKYLNSRLITTSFKNDKIIRNNGFKNTYVGYDRTGLSKYWHGVYLKKIDNKFYKKVPLIVKRKKKPKYSLDAHVEKIVDNKIYFLSICKNKNEIIRIYSSRVILAAGILENIRLLSLLVNKKLKVILNDHEWYNLGFIKTEEAIRKKFLKKKFFFIFRDKLLVKKIEKVDLVIEFRPYSQIQLNNESFKFYTDIKNNIFLKIINNFSFSRINEAFFNKFGFSFFTDQVILSALLNNKNSIINNFKSIKKKRLSQKTLQKIAQKIKLEFKSLVILNKNETFDSQHINGGEKRLKETKIKNLIKSNKIYIAGFPYKIENRNFYPTKFFIEKEKST